MRLLIILTLCLLPLLLSMAGCTNGGGGGMDAGMDAGVDSGVDARPAMPSLAITAPPTVTTYTCAHFTITTLGPSGLPGLWIATGHFRNGILLAPATATMIASLILGGAEIHDARPFDPRRLGGSAS